MTNETPQLEAGQGVDQSTIRAQPPSLNSASTSTKEAASNCPPSFEPANTGTVQEVVVQQEQREEVVVDPRWCQAPTKTPGHLCKKVKQAGKLRCWQHSKVPLSATECHPTPPLLGTRISQPKVEQKDNEVETSKHAPDAFTQLAAALSLSSALSTLLLLRLSSFVLVVVGYPPA